MYFVLIQSSHTEKEIEKFVIQKGGKNHIPHIL